MNLEKNLGEYTILDHLKEMEETSKPIEMRYKKEMFGEEMWIRIEDIKIDIAVQRELQEAHVQKIARKFDPAAFGRLIVTKREDGQFYCTDGQHRMRAAQTLGITSLPCVMVNLCDKADEGLNFIKVNQQSAKVTNLDKYRIGVSSGVKEWKLVEECVEYINAQVGTGRDRISCVGTIHNLLNKSVLGTSRDRDLYTVKKAMYILNRVYGVNGVTDLMLKGMFTFLRNHVIENEDTTIDQIIEKLEGSNFKEFATKAYNMRENNGNRGKTVSYIAYLIYAKYNEKIRVGKLPLRIIL